MIEATTVWCRADDEGYYDTPNERFAFCPQGLANAGWVVPRGAAVRIQIRDEYVEGASLNTAEGLCASGYIYEVLRRSGLSPFEAVYWWPEWLEEE